MWRGSLRDGDGEGNHVRPERDGKRAERRGKDQRDHVEGRPVAARAHTEREYDRGYGAYRRKDEQIGPFQPTANDAKIFRKCIAEDDDQEDKQANRQVGNKFVGEFAKFAFALRTSQQAPSSV